jgi:hypothetical protein
MKGGQLAMAKTTFHVRGIAAFFRTESDAEAAILGLKDAGFSADQIGISVGDYDLSPERRSRGERNFWEKVSDLFSGKTGYEDLDTGFEEGPRKEGLVISRTFTIPDNYQDRINQGGALVTVMTVENNTRTAEAEGILTRHNGEIEHDFERFQPVDTTAKDFVDQGQCIQLLSEVLRVHRERVQRGEIMPS